MPKNETDLQVDALDYEFDDEPGTELEEDLGVSALDSLESDNYTGSLNIPSIQIFATAPKIILAAASIIRPEATIMNVTATVAGGAVTLTSNPSISVGINGQLLVLRGSSATDTITLTDGNGMLMAGNITLGLDDTITFYFDGIINNKWVEVCRNLNTVQTYTETNVTPDRAFDADSTTTGELADVLGTLIVDLRKWGILK